MSMAEASLLALNAQREGRALEILGAKDGEGLLDACRRVMADLGRLRRRPEPEPQRYTPPETVGELPTMADAGELTDWLVAVAAAKNGDDLDDLTCHARHGDIMRSWVESDESLRHRASWLAIVGAAHREIITREQYDALMERFGLKGEAP